MIQTRETERRARALVYDLAVLSGYTPEDADEAIEQGVFDRALRRVIQELDAR